MRVTLAGAAVAAMLLVGAGFRSPSPAPAAPGLTIVINPAPALVNSVVSFTALNPIGLSGGLVYQWDFGDGTVTPFLPGNDTITHTYTSVAHVTIVLNVQDVLSNSLSATKTLTIHNPIPAAQPTNSSTIILDSANMRVWCVNADQDTVTAIDVTTPAFPAKVLEIPVGKNPRTLAQAADKTIWVVSQQAPTISILDPLTGALQHVVPLPHGSLPYGICMTPDGSAAYVSFQGLGGVAKISTSTRQTLATSAVPPSARGVSVSGDGRVFVTRFLSPQTSSLLLWNSAQFIAGNHGEVVEFNSSLGVVRTVNLGIDPGIGGADPDFGSNVAPATNGSRGVPNYLTSMVISPDGTRAWVPSKKDNLQRGTKTPERDGRTPSAETTYRAIVSSIDLTSTTKTSDELSERIDNDNSEMPQAACISPLGDLLFVALQGNNRVQVIDLYDKTNLLNGLGEATGVAAPGPADPTTGIVPAAGVPDGLAPQGLVLDPATKRLYVHNYMGRTVASFDATNVLASDGVPTFLGTPVMVGTITGGDAADKLPFTPGTPSTNVLEGKRVFYNASDVRMSRLGYISCAGCHLDGGSDMRVWDFTNRGEGFRNTIVLQGRGGTAMGNVHWSANFNEIQDFDNDVFARFHDAPNPPSFTGNPGLPNQPLGATNAGRSADLDALNAYVSSLTKVSRSPFRNPDGTLTAQGAAGEAVFNAKNCQKCHTGRNFTDSQVGTGAPVVDVFPPPAGQILLHNVGTLKPTSGGRLGGVLPGIDTPTLKGVWQTAPYLHDGSAATIEAVLSDASGSHFPVLTAQEQADLAEYMREIDELDAPPVNPVAPAPTVVINSVSTGKPYSISLFTNTNMFPYIDRSYRLGNFPGVVPGWALIRTAEDDKDVSVDNHITITVTGNSIVYVFYDNRAASLPNWLSAFPINPANQTVLGLNGVVYGFHGQSLPSGGTVTLGGNMATGAAGALKNYFVGVYQPANPVVQEGPLNLNEWAHDRDSDGDGLQDEFEAVGGSSPWKVVTNPVGTIPDEDVITASGKTAFEDQVVALAAAAAAAPAPASGGGGGGGGCGFIGLEPFAVVCLASLLRKRRRS
jgi:DNA-binding beta-propeller fold protein YncE